MIGRQGASKQRLLMPGTTGSPLDDEQREEGYVRSGYNRTRTIRAQGCCGAA